MPSLLGKTVLVTGAAGGFGREITQQLLREGCFLVLTDRCLTTIHEAVVAAAHAPFQQPAGKILAYVAADLASSEGCDRLFRQVQTTVPQIDVLINNAGIAFHGNFVDVPAAKWETLMQVNLLAAMRLSALFLPGMIQQKQGHIVNIASCAGLVGTPSLVAYSTAKFGLRGFSEALAFELEPHGIAVTALYPFFARTPMLESEHFGDTLPTPLPERIIEDPAKIIAALIAGMRVGKRHIYPSRTAQAIHMLQRLAPWAIPLVATLNRGRSRT